MCGGLGNWETGQKAPLDLRVRSVPALPVSSVRSPCLQSQRRARTGIQDGRFSCHPLSPCYCLLSLCSQCPLGFPGGRQADRKRGSNLYRPIWGIQAGLAHPSSVRGPPWTQQTRTQARARLAGGAGFVRPSAAFQARIQACEVLIYGRPMGRAQEGTVDPKMAPGPAKVGPETARRAGILATAQNAGCRGPLRAILEPSWSPPEALVACLEPLRQTHDVP